MASSTDEAAALKRNVVHQTRLKLALRQLDRDRSLRIREIDKDTQVFLHRLGETKKRVSLPDLRNPSQPSRAASAPVRQRRLAGTTTEPQRVTTTSPQESSSNPSFVTKPFYKLTNNDQRFRGLGGSGSLSSSSSSSHFYPPIKRHETPSREHETRTPRDFTVSPRSSKTRKEVRFSLPLDYADEEDRQDTQRTLSPIVSKGVGLMKIQSSADRPFRRYSAPHVRSKYL